ncbi:MAG: glycosyl transferase family 28 [Prevotellaceae bacterium]|nr:glycosyl transferase family 28 [Prevotellaceae bacterium]
MIFASLGTMDMPFVRMAEAVEKLASVVDEDVIVQTGYTDYDYKYAKAFRFCTKDEMQEYISKADILILQGGWGAISEAMEQHRRIVVMPRHDKTEHIHDQFQLVRKLDEMGCVIGVCDENELPAALEKAKTFDFKQIKKGQAEPLIRQKLNEWLIK